MSNSVIKAAVLSAFCWLLYQVVWTDAAQSSTRYKVESLSCDINYGHVIATTHANSAIHCSSNCASWKCCRSIVFNVSTATCYLNSKTKNSSDMVQGECGKELKYIEKEVNKTEQQAISRQCESTAECIEKNWSLSVYGTCRRSKCTCGPPPFHYNIIDNTCHHKCQNYDDTFEWYSSFNKDWSDKAKRSNVSLEECQEACICETSFTCSWFSYHAESAFCTYTDGYDNGYDYTRVYVDWYRRFCADP